MYVLQENGPQTDLNQFKFAFTTGKSNVPSKKTVKEQEVVV